MNEIGAEAVAHPALRGALGYWIAKRAAVGGLPRRGDIDPLDLPAKTLPHVMIAELVAPGRDGNETGRARWRYRLVGTAVVQAAHEDPTGGWLDAVLRGGYGDYVLGLYDLMARHARPVFSRSTYRGVGDMAADRRTERLMMPLAANADGRAPAADAHAAPVAGMGTVRAAAGSATAGSATAGQTTLGVAPAGAAEAPVRYAFSVQVFSPLGQVADPRSIIADAPFDDDMQALVRI